MGETTMVKLDQKLIQAGAMRQPLYMDVKFSDGTKVQRKPADARFAWEIVGFRKNADGRLTPVLRPITLNVRYNNTSIDLTQTPVDFLEDAFADQVVSVHSKMGEGANRVFFLNNFAWRWKGRSALFVTPVARPAFMAAVAKANAEGEANAQRAEKEAAKREAQWAERAARAKAEAEQRRLNKKAARKAAEAEAIAAEKAKIAAIPVGAPADFVTTVQYEDEVPESMMAPVQYRASASEGPVEIRTAYPARDAELDAEGNIIWSIVYFTSEKDAKELDSQTMEERRKSLAA